MDIYGISGRCFQRFLSDMGVGDGIEKIFAGDYIIGTPLDIVFSFEADRTQFPGDILIRPNYRGTGTYNYAEQSIKSGRRPMRFRIEGSTFPDKRKSDADGF